MGNTHKQIVIEENECNYILGRFETLICDNMWQYGKWQGYLSQLDKLTDEVNELILKEIYNHDAIQALTSLNKILINIKDEHIKNKKAFYTNKQILNRLIRDQQDKDN